MKKVIVLVLASSICFAATACNAVKGLGRALESVGQAGDQAM